MGKIYQALERAETKSPELHQASELPGFDFDPTNELVVLGKPGSSIAEQFRFLRSKITRPTEGVGPKTILITSSLKGEGKTFVSSNLAATIAQSLDEHVLLVDADLRNPQLHNVFGLSCGREKGLTTHLSEGTSLEELLCRTSIGKLTVLPAGKAIANPAELLASHKMKAFVAEVGSRYPDRVVIFDSPPTKLAPESLIMANEVDGIFLLVRRASTPRDIVRASLEKFKHEKFMGVILNGDKNSARLFKSQRNGSKGDGNGYGYGYGYGYKD
jgi:exopolysaccharide/PEP-CTERM locus tyrosine autokinase